MMVLATNQESVMKLVVTGEIPDELAQHFHQWIRDYDAAHPGCHFEVVFDAAGTDRARGGRGDAGRPTAAVPNLDRASNTRRR
jgi:hypothetical protein